MEEKWVLVPQWHIAYLSKYVYPLTPAPLQTSDHLHLWEN